MVAYVLGVAAVYAGLLAWGVWAERSWLGAAGWAGLVASVAGAPVVGAMIAAEVVERVRPRRGFDWRARCAVGVFVRGVVVGVVSAVVGAVGLALMDDVAPDGVILSAAAMAASGAGALTMARARAGHCVACGYDLRAAPGVVCPECGRAGSRAAGAPGSAARTADEPACVAVRANATPPPAGA